VPRSNDYRTDFDQIWRKLRAMLYAYVRGQLIIAALIGFFSGIACFVLGLADPSHWDSLRRHGANPLLGPFIGHPAILVGLAISRPRRF